MSDITYHWMGFVKDWVINGPHYSYAQERVFLEGLSMWFHPEAWALGCSHQLSDLGYSDKGTKMTQLSRDYMNLEAIDEARKAFWKRKDQAVTSWAIPTIGAAKRNAQGHCIRNMVVNYHHPKVSIDGKGKLTIHLQYRTTELLRKFGADLIFLRDVLIPRVLDGNPWQENPSEVWINFASCFFSALFIPVFYQYVDPQEFLEELYSFGGGDTLFYRRCFYRTKTMLERDASHYKFASRRNMADFAHRLFDSGKIDKQKLLTFLEKEAKKYEDLS